MGSIVIVAEDLISSPCFVHLRNLLPPILPALAQGMLHLLEGHSRMNLNITPLFSIAPFTFLLSSFFKNLPQFMVI